MKVIVVGAGASGLVAAIKAKMGGADVTILEKNTKVGKKLLLTGNGRCNYWHDNITYENYLTSNKSSLETIINNAKNKVLPFFDDLGIVPKVINGYYYPFSNQATSIVNALLSKVNELNIEIIFGEEVVKIEKNNNFVIETKENKYMADKVIIASGSKSYEKTGSDGSSYKLASLFNHRLSFVYPALVHLNGNENYFKEWAGVRCDAKVSLEIDKKVIKEERGEVQFTKTGVSGICIFNLSNYIKDSLVNKKEVYVNINFVPWFDGSKEEFKLWLDEKSKKRPKMLLVNMLEGFLNYKIVNLIVKRVGNNFVKWEDCNQELLLDLLFSFNLKITSTGDFDDAQVCGGGILLDEINCENMESKLVKGLYFTGELLDVVGFCGGYNLGFAWMSGIIAGNGVLND